MTPLSPAATDRLRENWTRIRNRIRAALERAGRPADSCRLLAVVKNQPDSRVAGLLALGQRDLAENRVQALGARAGSLRRDGTWHLIGHLQSNKARRARREYQCFHGLDSANLAQRLRTESPSPTPWPVYLQVNVADEPQKFGCQPSQAAEIAAEVRRSGDLQLVGLMAMAPLGSGPEQARPWFAKLARLSEDLRRRGELAPEATGLSMGMSQDFEVAVEEGATLVRVGSALFDGIESPG